MEEGTGITFGEIWSALKRRLWQLLALTAALTALIVLGIVFLYNPMKSTYSLTFTLSYPNSASGKYPDGTPFYYQEIISAEALASAKSSDARFSRINVDKLSEKDGISISAEQTGSDVALFPEKYTVTAEASYFSGKTSATEFLKALAYRTVLNAVGKARSVSYTLEKTAFENADYDDRLELLLRQKSDLLAKYDEWIELYSGNYSAAGRTLFNHRAETDVLFGAAQQESLANELETNGYVPLEMLEAQRSALEAEKRENEAKIEEIKRAMQELPAASFTVSEISSSAASEITVQQPLDLSETLAALLVRNVQIDSRLNALTEENVKAFEASLSAVYEKLQEAANKVQAVGIALFEAESGVHYETSQAVERGGIGIAFAAIGGLLLSLFLACFIVGCIEVPKQRKRRAQTAEAPAAAEEKAGQEE